jgi:hypothetical protein
MGDSTSQELDRFLMRAGTVSNKTPWMGLEYRSVNSIEAKNNSSGGNHDHISYSTVWEHVALSGLLPVCHVSGDIG